MWEEHGTMSDVAVREQHTLEEVLDPITARAGVARQKAEEKVKRSLAGKVAPEELVEEAIAAQMPVEEDQPVFCCTHHQRYAVSRAKRDLKKLDDFLAMTASFREEQASLFDDDAA
jgi:hypothetical protein